MRGWHRGGGSALRAGGSHLPLSSSAPYREQPGGGGGHSGSPGRSQPLRLAQEQPHPESLRRAPRPPPAVPPAPQEGSLRTPPIPSPLPSPPSHRDTWTGKAALQRGHRETAAGNPGSARDRTPIPPPPAWVRPCRRRRPAALGAPLSIKPGWLWERRPQELSVGGSPWGEGSGEGAAMGAQQPHRDGSAARGRRGQRVGWGGRGWAPRRPNGGSKARAVIGPTAAVGGDQRWRQGAQLRAERRIQSAGGDWLEWR